ncbi:hypothetical protein ENBRE01_0349 [Enteropsectra breve]|nr:hypothetical protein ENBRE01_0349 [Enteropsectra breve]
MNTKHFIWAVPSTVLIGGLGMYGIQKQFENKKTVQPTENIHENVPKVRLYREEPADLGTAELIVEKAKTFIVEYENLDQDEVNYVVAGGLMLSFMNCTKRIICDYDTCRRSYFKPGDLTLLYRGFLRNKMDIQWDEVMMDNQELPKLSEGECPIGRIFAQTNRTANWPMFMCDVGCSAKYENTTGDNPYAQTETTRRFYMLDIKGKMDGNASVISLDEYLSTLHIPADDHTIEYFGKGVDFTGIDYFCNILVFCSDSSEKPSTYMPRSFEIRKNPTEDKLYTYELKSVIIMDGSRNDIYKMKVLHRPEENIDEFVEVANEKGCYYLYETQ